MTKPAPKNLPASVRQKLANLARERNVDFGLILVKYGLERILFRLSRSRHRDVFILKGALLFELWTEQRYRPTRDADFLSRGDNAPERFARIFRELFVLEVDEDGLRFDAESVEAERIGAARDEENPPSHKTSRRLNSCCGNGFKPETATFLDVVRKGEKLSLEQWADFFLENYSKPPVRAEKTFGFDFLYEQKFAEVREAFASWESRNPEDPFGVVAVAASYLFEELDLQGVLTSDFFLNEKKFLRGIDGRPDPERMGHFREALARARELARERQKPNPEDG